MTKEAESLDSLEGAIGYAFKDSSKLREALTHKSRSSERGLGFDNERLEFVGDGVLAGVLAIELYRSFPAESEGDLSLKKSHLASRSYLAQAAERLRLGEYLALGEGEEKSGGRSRPSLAANALEALIGAVALDGGLPAAEAFIRRHCLDGLTAETPVDFKSRLQELVQRRFKERPAYETQPAGGPEHDRVFESRATAAGKLIGEGRGKSKKSAEQAAAQDALEKLGYFGKNEK